MKKMTKMMTLILLAQVLATGCMQKKTTANNTTVNQNSSGNSSPITTPTPSPTSTSTGSSTTPGSYYSLSLITHGGTGGYTAWSSDADLDSSVDENILKTNSRLNVRVVPQSGYRGTDSRGVACTFDPLPFTKLKVGIEVKKKGASTGDYVELDASVGQNSKIKEFRPSSNARLMGTSDPYVITVKNVQWDYGCIYYKGFETSAQYATYCPWYYVWPKDCVRFDLQFSTDDTTDMTGNRI